MPRASTRPDRIERKTIDGTEAKVSVYADFAHPSYDQRMEIEYDGRPWEFGIDQEDVASAVPTTAGQAEVPSWTVESFRSLELEGDE